MNTAVLFPTFTETVHMRLGQGRRCREKPRLIPEPPGDICMIAKV